MIIIMDYIDYSNYNKNYYNNEPVDDEYNNNNNEDRKFLLRIPFNGGHLYYY